MSKNWSYGLSGPGLCLVEPRLPAAGAQGVLWVLADDDEVYGVEAYVLMAMDEHHRLTLQTATPLDPIFRDTSRWALLADGEVLGYGP